MVAAFFYQKFLENSYLCRPPLWISFNEIRKIQKNTL